jgi:hypothetical protein
LIALGVASLFVVVFADVDTRLASPGLLLVGVVTSAFGIYRVANPDWRSRPIWVKHRGLAHAFGGFRDGIPRVPPRYLERFAASLQVFAGIAFIGAAVVALLFPP